MENKFENSRKNTSTFRSQKILKITDFGRVPPQAVELEQAVLGALLLNQTIMDEVLMIVNTDSFYDPRHTSIFKAIYDLYKSSKAIDILTVINRLKSLSELELAGGASYISTLTSNIASTANVESHARIVSEKYIQREIIRLSSELLSEAFNDGADIFELINKVESGLFEITSKNIKKNADEMRDVVYQAVLEIEEARKNKEGISGIPTGFRDLDKITGGWQRSDMIVIAARPAMGKTAFVLSMARNIAVDFGKAVAIFSLEMSSVQLVKRLISSETKLTGDQIMKGKLQDHEMQQLHSRIQKLIEAPIYIDDTPGLSVFDFRAKCRKLKSTKNIDIIIIDYLQLMSGGPQKGNGNREQEISIISRTIKEVAKELNVPVIALAQLSRSVETRGGSGGRPILSDLRESGSIEQDADIVSFIYRAEKYGITVDGETGESNIGVGEIIIEKHRNGELANIRLGFVGQFTMFTNLNDYDDSPVANVILNNDKSFESDDDGNKRYIFQSKMNEDDTDFNLDNFETPF
jgi:replicative DNA helicase